MPNGYDEKQFLVLIISNISGDENKYITEKINILSDNGLFILTSSDEPSVCW